MIDTQLDADGRQLEGEQETLDQKLYRFLKKLEDHCLSNEDFTRVLQQVNQKGSSGRSRRLRTKWSSDEVEKLLRGVIRCGIGNWSVIHSTMNFDSKRTFTDIKDKWRNLLDPRCNTQSLLQYKYIAIEIKRQFDVNGVVDEQGIFEMFQQPIQNGQIESKQVANDCNWGSNYENAFF